MSFVLAAGTATAVLAGVGTRTDDSMFGASAVSGAAVGDYVTTSPTLSIDDVSMAEGNAGTTTFTFTVSLSQTLGEAVIVDYTTADGTATTGDNDYVATSGTLTIPANTLSATLAVDVVGDIKNEPDETFLLSLVGDPSNASIVKRHGTGTIQNDDDTVDPEVTVTAPNGGESFATGELIALTWDASDNVDVAWVDLYVSYDGGATYKIVRKDVANLGTFGWRVSGPPTAHALLKVVAHDAAGNSAEDVSDAEWEITLGPVGVEDEAIAEFALTRVAPNPARGPALIEYTVAREAPVRLSVLDVQGRTVAVLVDGTLGPGRYQSVWNGESARGRVVAGAYFVRYEAGGKRVSRRIVLLP